MANIRFYLFVLLLAFVIAMVIAQSKPEGEPEGEPEGTPENGIEAENGANSEPEDESHNSVSHAKAQIFTTFALFIAFVLLK